MCVVLRTSFALATRVCQRINCRGKNQKKRFRLHTEKLKEQIKEVQEITNGIHTIAEFEMLK